MPAGNDIYDAEMATIFSMAAGLRSPDRRAGNDRSTVAPTRNISTRATATTSSMPADGDDGYIPLNPATA